MKTVVTGGAGFIGSNLVKRLVDQGREVVIADDFSRGRRLNLSDLGIQVDCPVVDLRDFAQALEVAQDAGTVFHLAARIGSIDYLHGSNCNELVALQTNLVIDANVFKACLENNVEKLIYASSVAVYSIDPQRHFVAVLSEDNLDLSQNKPELFNPDGGYGWAKLMGEIQLNWMGQIDVGIARIFNVYGENQDLERAIHVIPALFRKAFLYPEEEFIVWGDGKQSRDFLHVSDCVDALLQLEERISNSPTVVNVGSGEPVSIATIAEKAIELSRKDIRIVYDPMQPVGPMSRTADMTKAKALLDWQPKVSLDEGLRRTYVWIQNRLKEK